MTFYLKYRPKNLDELDLESVRESLKKIVKSGNIPHAFLFSGPKGVGKTSAARILAKVVNCENRKKRSIEPCNKCSQCKTITNGNNLDVIELDAASHRGIDDVRALREAVKLAPNKAKKKVYIIDEAHMMTVEASNALLKTLEEPPDHVIFILATTNPEKLIPTIRSRATNIVFKKPTTDEILRSLKRVVKGEKIKADKKALKEIAKASGGSFRDAHKILDQAIAEGKSLKEKDIEELISATSEEGVERLLSLLSKKDIKKSLAEIDRVISQGTSAEVYVESILGRLRLALLAKVGVDGKDLKDFDKKEIINLIEVFSAVQRGLRGAFIEQLPLEVAVIKWCEEEEGEDSGGGDEDEEGGKEVKKKKGNSKKKTSNNGKTKKAEVLGKMGQNVWSQILAAARPRNTSIEALLRAAKPIGFDGKRLTLGVFYSFHKERLEEDHHRKVLEEIVTGVVGKPVRVICRLTNPPEKKVEEKEEVVLTEGEDEDIIKVAEEIFGS